MPPSRFDVDAYAASARNAFRDELHVDAYPPAAALGGAPGAFDYLRHRVGDTARWLSVVLVTAAHKDARLTAFLSAWAVERHWAADALAAMAGDAPPTVDAQRRGDRTAPLRAAIRGNIAGEALIAAQVTERLLDTRLTDLLLERAALVARDEAVSADVQRVRGVLARHLVFFGEEARRRLAEDPRARTITRRHLLRTAWPVGAERLPPAATARVLDDLLPDPAWADALDAEVDALPGLAGLRLFTRTAANPGRAPLRMKNALRSHPRAGRREEDQRPVR